MRNKSPSAASRPSTSASTGTASSIFSCSLGEQYHDHSISRRPAHYPPARSSTFFGAPSRPEEIRTTPVVCKFRDEKTHRPRINNYLVGRVLGTGQLSSIREYEAIDPDTGEVTGRYACKRYRKGILCRKKQFKRDAETGRMHIVTKLDEVKNEIWVLSQLNHPNCLRLHEVLESGSSAVPSDGKIYIITNLQACGGVMSLQDDLAGRLDLSGTACDSASCSGFSFSGSAAAAAAAAEKEKEEEEEEAAEGSSGAAAARRSRQKKETEGGSSSWGSSHEGDSSSSAQGGSEDGCRQTERSNSEIQQWGGGSSSSSGRVESSNFSSPREKFTPGLKGISTLPEEACRCIIRDAARGLQYMHEELNMAHRDVKPNNLLLGEDGVVQLGDMDTAEMMDSHGFVRHTKGTYMFMAPECMQVSSTADEPYVGHSGRAADVWALGITLYIMLLARPPFNVSSSLDQLFEEIARGEVELPASPSLSPAAVDVLRGLLEKDVAKRMTLKELLEHPWVKEADSRHAQLYAAKVMQQVRQREAAEGDF